MTASSPEDSDISKKRREILEELLELEAQPELVKECLTNSTRTYVLLKRISKVVLLLYYLKEGEREEREQLVKGFLTIYCGKDGPKIISYLLKHGAGTPYTLMMELNISKQTISNVMSKLERLGFVKRRDQAIPDRRIIKRGPRDRIWTLVGATPEIVKDAVIEDLRWRNPEKAKAMKEEAEAKREEERRQNEEAVRKLEEEAKDLSWINSQVDELLKSVPSEKKFDYPEVDSFIKTIKEPLIEARPLHYRIRDILKDRKRWNPEKVATTKGIPAELLPIPDNMREEVLKAKEDFMTLCTGCKATYSIHLACCPGCGERNIWKKYKKIRVGKADRYEEIPATSSTTPTSHDPEELTPINQNIDSKAHNSPSAGTEPKSGES